MHSTARRYRIAILLTIAAVLLGIGYTLIERDVQATQESVLIRLSPTDGFLDGTTVGLSAGSKLVKFQPGRKVQMDSVRSRLLAEGVDVNSAEPLSLASEDLNGDTYPDLVSGYRSPGGSFLVVYYGSERAYSPSDEEILSGIREERRFPMPFGSARIVRLETAPELLTTGDFDRDGLKDVVTATRGSSLFELVASDRQNNFRGVERIAVSGSITAIGAGQISVGDANTDLVVGLDGEAALLVYSSSESILTQRPEIRPIAGIAERIVFGDLDAAQGEDIVVASGSRIFVMQGRGSGVDTIELPSRARDIAIGEFIWDRDSRPEIAFIGDDGMTRIVANGRLDTREFTEAEVLAKRRFAARVRNGESKATTTKVRAADWRIAEVIASNGSFLSRARISTQPSDDLLVTGGAVDVITRDKAAQRSATRLSPSGEPLAILPMRLSVMGVPGMVMLQKGEIEPTLVMVAPQATFTVDTNADNAALTACTGAAGDCSLRGAVIASNANGVGADIITFNVGQAPQLTVTSGGNAENAAATGDLDVNGSLTITGNAPTTLTTTYNNTCGDCKLFGMDQTGAFPGINVSISGMSMSGGFNNGAAFCGSFFETGGGIDFFLQDTGNVFSLSGSVLSGNTATGCAQSHGGGINIDSVGAVDAGGASSGSVTLNGNTISSNSAAFQGGGVNMFSAKHDVTMASTLVTGNTSLGGGGGGGVRIRHTWGGTVTINGGGVSGVNSNTAPSGGGIMIDGNQVANIGVSTGILIQNNNATGVGGIGGGVAITNLGAFGVTGSTQINNSSIILNHADNATGKGGGLYFLPAYSATLSNTGIGQNTSPVGAGVFNGSTSAAITLGLTNCNLSSNAATGAGGGLRNEGANAVTNINGLTTASNTSGSGGDAIELVSGAINMSGSIVLGDNESINLTAGTFTSTSGNMNIGGSITRAAAATFVPNAGTVIWDGTGTQNINGTATSIPFHNFTVNKAVSGTVQASGSVTTLPIAGNMTLTQGTFAPGTATAVQMTGGNWIYNGGTFSAGSSVVTFSGSSVQNIGLTSPTTFNGLTINNAAGVTMNQNETVNGALTMTNGELTISGTNVLTIGTAGTTSRTAGHVNGRVRKIFSAPGTFPYHVGTPAAYSPVTANVTAGSGDLTLRAVAGIAPSTPVLPVPTTMSRYWELLEAGALTANLTFNYLEGDPPAGTETNMRLIRSYGATVRPLSFANVAPCPGAGSTCVNTTANTIFQSGVVEFNGFWTAGAPTVPTAATAAISGRVLDTQGRGLGRVRVIITDATGSARTAVTSSFGYYSFESLSVGQTYVVSAQSKQNTFIPRTISLGEDAVGFDLIAEP